MLGMSARLPGLGSPGVGLLAPVLPQLLNGIGFQARRVPPFFRSKALFGPGDLPTVLRRPSGLGNKHLIDHLGYLPRIADGPGLSAAPSYPVGV